MNTTRYDATQTRPWFWLVYLTLAAVAWGCITHDDDVIPVEKSYTDPQAKVEELEQRLLSSPDGWNGWLTLPSGGTYTVYFSLAGTNAKLFTDADTVSAATSRITKFEVGIAQNKTASLDFGTSTNLARINNVDVSFAYRYAEGDTLVMLGNEKGSTLKLFKASADDRQRYEARALKNAVKEISKYLTTARFLFANPAPGKTLQLTLNPLARSAYGIYLDKHAMFAGSDYAYTLHGIRFNKKLHFAGLTLDELYWDGVQKNLYALYNDARINFLPTGMPAIPLHYLLGDEYPADVITFSPHNLTIPGWSPTFRDLWLKDDDALYKKKQIALYVLEIKLDVASDAMDLYIYYFTADEELHRGKFPYRYEKSSDGVYTFEAQPLKPGTTEGDAAVFLEPHLPNILSTINGHNFRIEFFDAYDTMGGLLPQFIDADDPDIYFTGLFY